MLLGSTIGTYRGLPLAFPFRRFALSLTFTLVHEARPCVIPHGCVVVRLAFCLASRGRTSWQDVQWLLSPSHDSPLGGHLHLSLQLRAEEMVCRVLLFHRRSCHGFLHGWNPEEYVFTKLRWQDVEHCCPAFLKRKWLASSFNVFSERAIPSFQCQQDLTELRCRIRLVQLRQEFVAPDFTSGTDHFHQLPPDVKALHRL